MRHYTIVHLLVLLLFILAACNQAEDPVIPEATAPVESIEEATAVPDLTPLPTRTTMATRAPLILDGVDEELVEAHSETIRFGRALVAEELGIEAASLTVTAVEMVDWPDGCLGMGQPGEGCTEALVPGLRIQVSIDDQIYEVRTDLDGRQYRWAAIQ
ncbi:MAG: hypothetical protein R6X32_04945 [Chloroflexota bacterium]|jgi:hypothetical protein